MQFGGNVWQFSVYDGNLEGMFSRIGGLEGI